MHILTPYMCIVSNKHYYGRVDAMSRLKFRLNECPARWPGYVGVREMVSNQDWQLAVLVSLPLPSVTEYAAYEVEEESSTPMILCFGN